MTAPPSTTRNPGPARNDTAHVARLPSEGPGPRRGPGAPNPVAPDLGGDRRDAGASRARPPTSTRSSPRPSSIPAPTSPGRTRGGRCRARRASPRRGPSTSGSSSATGRRRQPEGQERHDGSGTTSDGTRPWNGPAVARADRRPATTMVYPPHHPPSAAASGRGRAPPVLTVGGDVDHGLARTEPARRATSSASPSSGTSETTTSPRRGARPRRAATGRPRCRPPATRCRWRAGRAARPARPAPTTSARTSEPGERTRRRPAAAPEHRSATRPSVAPRRRDGSSDPGRAARRRSMTVIASQCARQPRPPSNAGQPESARPLANNPRHQPPRTNQRSRQNAICGIARAPRARGRSRVGAPQSVGEQQGGPRALTGQA